MKMRNVLKYEFEDYFVNIALKYLWPGLMFINSKFIASLKYWPKVNPDQIVNCVLSTFLFLFSNPCRH